MSDRVKPADCRNMAEIRHGIDRLDDDIVALLAERFRYMEAAARIKQDRAAVRDEERKGEVIARAAATAQREGAPAERVAALYDALIEASIAFELERFDALRA